MKKRRKSKPIEITEGSVTVKIYHTPTKTNGTTYPAWTLIYHLHGKKIRQKSAKLGDLTIAGKDACRRIANAQTATLTMTDAQVAEWTSVQAALQVGTIALRRPLSAISVVDAHLETLKILEDKATPQEAARAWRDRNKDILPISTVKLVEEFHAAKKTENCGTRHLDDLENRLKIWTAHFQCNISDITKRDYQEWIRALKVSAQTRLHYHRAVTNLSNYAKTMGYLPESWNELKNIQLGILSQTVIETYTAAQMERILRGALGQIPLLDAVTWTGTNKKSGKSRQITRTITEGDKETFYNLIPFIVTGSFAGLRTAERCRTSWPHFNWETGFIRVTGKRTGGRTTRSSSNRLVPINETTRHWLEPFIPKPNTPEAEALLIGTLTEPTAIDKFSLLCRAVGIDPVENGLRHSYISYRCAEPKADKSDVAKESGNSSTTIDAHYLDLKTPAQAAAWFALRRELAQNITQLKATA
jgi:integrase